MSSLRTGLVLLSLLILVITLALHSTSPLVPSSLSTQPLNFPPLLHPPPPLTCTKTHCLPNFLILGAGKSGTSSLYTYLTSHPLILPALHKQIHYYKYYYTKGISWYRSKFPTRKQLEDADAVMTGEAAPGYLPYPYVADRIYKGEMLERGRQRLKRYAKEERLERNDWGTTGYERPATNDQFRTDDLPKATGSNARSRLNAPLIPMLLFHLPQR